MVLPMENSATTVFNFNSELKGLAKRAEERARPMFTETERIEQENAERVLSAFIAEGITATHLNGSTGYGYGDRGRDALERVFARVFGTEDALVRHTFMSGTHAIYTVLSALLRPGQTLVSLAGKPYDTLDPVIGIEPTAGSLTDYGVHYRQVELKDDAIDLPEAIKQCADAHVALIQRSRGYSLRNSISVAEIGRICDTLQGHYPNLIIVVDNCYGEFVESSEPTHVGADLVVGSLIKNPGGGIAKTGAYIAGRTDLVELCAARHSAPGVGREIGASLDELRSMYLGLFMAPTVTAAAVKTAIFTASLFELLNFEVYPPSNSPRTDIITALTLGTPEKLIAFCRGIQKGSPIDSAAVPEPWDMPGYQDEVIMAAGTFTGGASIELSADAPLREPYAVWVQGGLSYPVGKLGILSACEEVMKAL